jgi:hypothetical protein
MANCPSCRRPVAMARATCLYCGASLPAVPGAVVPRPPDDAAAAGGEPPLGRTPGGSRSLVVLDLDGVSADTLARALDVPPYEAGLVARRGGFHLHRVLEHAAAEAEAGRLGARGLAAFLVPEAEARVRPLRALGGEQSEGALALRTEEGPLAVHRGDLLLVVRGPIAREYQPSSRRRRVSTARLDEGYRVHLHRGACPREPAGTSAGDGRPVEIDAATFEFGFAVTGSARLELDAWVEAVAGTAPRDDGFRRLPPALGPADPEPKGALAAVSSLRLASRDREGRRGEASVVLDNVEQFRFYSGWRAAVERRRSRP